LTDCGKTAKTLNNSELKGKYKQLFEVRVVFPYLVCQSAPLLDPVRYGEPSQLRVLRFCL